MTLGNKVKGQEGPPPLPMYKPVVLRHVPTIVRRRYEGFEANHLELEVDSNHEDVKSGGDRAIDSDVPHSAFDLGSNVEGEAHDNGEESFEGELESRDDRAIDASVSHFAFDVGSSVEDEAHGNREENFDSELGLLEIQESRLRDVNQSHGADVVDEWQGKGHGDFTDGGDNNTLEGGAGSDIFQLEGSSVQNITSEDDAAAVADHAFNVDNSEAQDEGTIDSLSEHGDGKKEDDGASSSNGACYASFEDQAEYKGERDSDDELCINGAWHANVGDKDKAECTRGGSENELEIKVITPENKLKRRPTPPPLPMYKPVVLKRVPTIIRRRYERSDADKIKPQIDNEDLRETHENANPINEVSIGKGDSIDGHGMGEEPREDDGSEIIEQTDSLAEIITSEGKLEVDSSSADEAEDKEMIHSGTENGHSISENYGGNCEDGAVLDIEDEIQDKRDGTSDDECDSLAETSTSKDKVIVDSDVEDEVQDKGNLDSGYEHGPIECADNGAKYENAAWDVEIQDKGRPSDHVQGWPLRASENEGNGAEDTSPSSDKESGNLIGNEGNGGEDSSPSDEDACLENETKKSGNLNGVNKQDTERFSEEFADNSLPIGGLDLDNLGREHHLSEVINLASDTDVTVKNEVQDKAHQYSDNEQDLKPEAVDKPSDQDGYELCCPICNHCITRTIIFKRRENNQPERTTCLSFLITLCGK